jgi:serine/threonine protein kinase
MAADPKSRVQPDAGGSIAVVCPCGKSASISAEHAGKKVRCSKCRRVLLVDPHSTNAPPSAAESMMAGNPGAATIADVSKSPRSYQDILSPPQQKDEIGRLGPYRVLEVLGAGGMGVVFKAEDPSLACLVALKAMLPSAAEKAAAKERFLREARAAAALKHHDHVVNIYRVDEDRGIPYLAMEFLDGESLEDCLRREGRLGISDVLRIGREIADGLAAAHERGLIHRDIKPANVWLQRRSVRRKDGRSDSSTNSAVRVKILDFGLARSADDATITQSGAIMGTAAYMPLEQARGERLDARCDLYSLGVVLYRMVTGKMPFEGNSLISVLTAMLSQTPVEPCEHDSNIPAQLNDLIMRLLSKNAADRPADASEVYAALCDIEEAPVISPPVETFAAVTEWPMTEPDKKSSPPRVKVSVASMDEMPTTKAVRKKPDVPIANFVLGHNARQMTGVLLAIGLVTFASIAIVCIALLPIMLNPSKPVRRELERKIRTKDEEAAAEKFTPKVDVNKEVFSPDGPKGFSPKDAKDLPPEDPDGFSPKDEKGFSPKYAK